jgi:hypothetical protein
VLFDVDPDSEVEEREDEEGETGTVRRNRREDF